MMRNQLLINFHNKVSLKKKTWLNESVFSLYKLEETNNSFCFFHYASHKSQNLVQLVVIFFNTAFYL